MTVEAPVYEIAKEPRKSVKSSKSKKKSHKASVVATDEDKGFTMVVITKEGVIGKNILRFIQQTGRGYNVLFSSPSNNGQVEIGLVENNVHREPADMENARCRIEAIAKRYLLI